MKKKNIIKGMLLMAAAIMTTGCSSDYLDVVPESEPNTGSISESLNAARLAVRGLGRGMNTQYQNVTTGNQFNGESYVNTIYNDGWGQDYYSWLGMQQFGSANYCWNTMGNARSSWIVNIPWNYSYQLIYLANGVLDGLEAQKDEENNEWKFLKAQALTFRAHAYVKLLQFFAPRWEDSKNGEEYCIVIRTSQSLEDVPLATMNEVRKLIYGDLDLAIQYFTDAEKAGMKREFKWETDKNVAEGIYARAAMIYHDWDIAKTHAHNAQTGYAVMDNNTAFAGFYKTNNDFMWESSSEDADIYYWSFGCHYTCNGHYSYVWGTAAGAISLDLYNQLDPNDIRRKWFLTPDKVNGASEDINPAKLKEADFWSKGLCDGTNVNINMGLTYKNRKKEPWGMKNFIAAYGLDYAKNTFTGDLNAITQAQDDGSNRYCYLQESAKDGGDKWFLVGDKYCTICDVPMGASYKFWSIQPYGTSTYPYMRCSEMVLTEAEAAYMAGDYTTAQSCLDKIQKLRIAGYTGGKSGQALLDEIRLCRRIELWGEGMSWSDLKRWNLPLVRRAWVEGDPTSGNIGTQCAMTRQPSDNAGWRFMVPAIETDYNKAINKDLLPQPSQYTTVNNN